MERSFVGLLEHRQAADKAERYGPKELLRIARGYKTSTEAAYGKEDFDDRRKDANIAIVRESDGSLRHLVAGVKAPGPWHTKKFWHEARESLTRAVDRASEPFRWAFNEDHTPDTTPRGVSALDIAVNEPGPAVPNRVLMMESMASIMGYDSHELATNEVLREQVATRVDETLKKIGVHALSEFVLDELKTAGFSDLPNPKDMRVLTPASIYSSIERLSDPKEDAHFRTRILDAHALTIERRSQKLTPDEQVFMRFVVAGAHATWASQLVHRSRWKGNTDAINKANNRPLPDLIRSEFARMTDGGVSERDAVLRIAYELFKDIRILRQEDRDPKNRVNIPEITLFAPEGASAVEATPKETRRDISRRSALAATAFLGAVGAPSAIREAEYRAPLEPLTSPEVRTVDMAISSQLAAESRGDGAIDLVDSLIRNIEKNPNTVYADSFTLLFPVKEGQTTRQRAHDIAQRIGMWKPGLLQARIQPGDYLEFDNHANLYFANASNRFPRMQLADSFGNTFPFAGETEPDR